jgi:hypothetical protein
MEFIIVGSLLAVLLCGLFVVNRATGRDKSRRRSEPGSRREQKRFGFKPVKSARSEMRANDDPTTGMRDADAKNQSQSRQDKEIRRRK